MDEDETDLDFIIVSVGSNDISKLNIDDNIASLNTAAIDHSTQLVALAEEFAVRHDIDVFVMERPARYDKKEKDPKAMKTKLNQTANGMLMALINAIEKVHLIKLPNLDNLSAKAKKDMFKNDGIHLTNVGLEALEDDLIAGMKTVYTNVKPRTRNSPKKQTLSENGHGRHWERVGGGRNGHQSQYADRQQQYGGRPNNDRHWNRDRREPGMQDMMRNFMAFMSNWTAGKRGRNRY